MTLADRVQALLAETTRGAGSEPDEGEPNALGDLLTPCLELQTPEDRVACAVEVARASPFEGETCPIHLVLLTQETCPHCPEAQQQLRHHLDAGEIEEIDVFSPRGIRYREQSGVRTTPHLLVVDCEDNVHAAIGNPLDPE